MYPQVERDIYGTNGLGCSTCHGLGDNLKGALDTVPTAILSKNIAAASLEEKFLVIKGDVMAFSIYAAGATAVVLGALPLPVSAGAAIRMERVRLCFAMLHA